MDVLEVGITESFRIAAVLSGGIGLSAPEVSPRHSSEARAVLVSRQL